MEAAAATSHGAEGDIHSYFEQMRGGGLSFDLQPPPLPPPPHPHDHRDSEGISDTNDNQYL